MFSTCQGHVLQRARVAMWQARARIKVNRARQHVYVLLHKEADAPWRFIRG